MDDEFSTEGILRLTAKLREEGKPILADCLDELAAQRDLFRALLIKSRDEFRGLPHSLGYEFTHLPEIDAVLKTST